jgi:hypothetical protein
MERFAKRFLNGAFLESDPQVTRNNLDYILRFRRRQATEQLSEDGLFWNDALRFGELLKYGINL